MSFKKLALLFASVLLLDSVSAVTIGGEANFDALHAAQTAALMEKTLNGTDLSREGGFVLSKQMGYDIAGPASKAEYNSFVALEAIERSHEDRFPMSVIPTNSLGIFSLALVAIGTGLLALGTFSLSFGRKLEGIAAQEFVRQLRHMGALSMRQNISRNWGVKRDATWFVVMGLCSIAAGIVDWHFL